MRELAGDREKGVVRLGSPQGNAGAFPVKGADGDAGALAGPREWGGVLAQAQPDEVRLGWRHRPAVRDQRLADPGTLLHRGLDALQELGLGPEGSDGGRLGHRVHAEGKHGLADGVSDRRVPDEEPNAQPGQPVGLGERAENRDVRAVAVQVNAVRYRFITNVLAVRLVEHDQAVPGYLVQEGHELALCYDRAGRVVRAADKDDPRARGDRRGHGVEVVLFSAQRDPDGRGARQVAQPRVRLKRAPRVDDFVPGPGGGLDDLLEDPD
jgi:hypothetical protein